MALRGLELRIEPRELVALYGPSGSGKSTALHLAAALDEPSAGELRVFGRSLTRLREAELADFRARQVAIVFDLQQRERQRAGSLSGGEQQRVAIAAAAAREAELVLADEPTAELDARNEQTVLRALRRLREEFGSTVVVVTHSPRVADAVDRVIEIRDGAVA